MSQFFRRSPLDRPGPRPPGVESADPLTRLAAGDDRALRDRMTLVSDSARKQLAAVTDLTRAEKALQVELEKTNRLMRDRQKLLETERRSSAGGGPGGVGGGQGGRAGGGGGGFAGGALGGVLARFAGPAALAGTGMALARGALDVAEAAQGASPWVTEARRRREAFRAAPFGVGAFVRTFGDIAEAEAGIPRRIGEAGRLAGLIGAEQALATESRQRVAGPAFGALAAEQRAGAMTGFALPALPAADRATAAGEVRFREALARQPAREEAARADVEREAAARSAAEAGERETALRAELDDARGKAKLAADVLAAVRRGQDAGGRVDRSQEFVAAERAALASQKVADTARLTEEATTRAVEARQTLLERESQLRRAGVDLAKADLGIAEQRAERSAADAGRLGGLSVGGREQALQAALFVKRHGVEAAGPALTGLAAQAFPDFVAKETERLGDERARDLRRRFLEGGGRPEDTEVGRFGVREARAAAERQRVEVQAKVVLDERETAKRLAEELGPFLAQLIKTIHFEVNARFQKTQADNIARAAGEK